MKGRLSRYDVVQHALRKVCKLAGNFRNGQALEGLHDVNEGEQATVLSIRYIAEFHLNGSSKSFASAVLRSLRTQIQSTLESRYASDECW